MTENDTKKEIIRSAGTIATVDKEFIFMLQKYVRLVPTVDPRNGGRVWIIAGKA